MTSPTPLYIPGSAVAELALVIQQTIETNLTTLETNCNNAATSANTSAAAASAAAATAGSAGAVAAAALQAALASTTAGQGDALLAVLGPYASEVGQTQHAVNQNWVSVFRWFTAAQQADVLTRTGSIDVSGAIMTAHAALAGTGRKLYFPSGVYLWATAQTTVNAPQWEGEAAEVYNGPHTSYGVQFKCTVTGATAYALTINSSSFSLSPYLRNLRFTGGGTASNALYLNNVGSTGTVENVCIDSFTGWGINSGYLQDIKFWNLWIYKCGATASTYGLGLGSLSNLIHFIGCRIEGCPGEIYANSVTGIFFINCHIELGTSVAYTTPPINIASSTGVKFDKCFFGAASIANQIALNGSLTPATVPFLMSTVNCIDLLMDGCTFINNNGGGSKYLSIAASDPSMYSTVTGCSFQNQDNQIYGVSTQYAKFTNNTLFLYDNTATTGGQVATNFQGISVAYGICDGNTLICENAGGTSKTAGYAIYAPNQSALGILGSNSIYVNKLYKYANSNWYTNNLGPVTSTSASPVSNIYDLELFPENTVFYVGSNTVNGLNNPKIGQVVTLANSGYSATITNSSSLNLEGATNATLGSNNIMKLQYLNFTGTPAFYEISRNF